VERRRPVYVEEESWMSCLAGKGGKVDGFLWPVSGVCRGGKGWVYPVREAGVVGRIR